MRKSPRKLLGWFEHYKCGCVSDVTRYKKDLLGYCGQHGHDRMEAPFQEYEVEEPSQEPS